MEADEALIRRVERSCWLGIVGANLATALAIIPSVTFTWPIYFSYAPLGRSLVLVFAVAVPYLLFGTITGLHLIVRPQLRPAVAWLHEGREPTDDERLTLATQPRRQSLRMLAYWVVFPLWAIPYADYVIGLEFRPIVTLKFVFGLLNLAFVAWTLSYLLVERSIRPLLALALSGAPDVEPRTMGVYRRLLVAWMASALLPFATVMVNLYGLTREQRQDIFPWLYFLCLIAIVAGIAATIVASHAITDPLQKVRDGMRAVERGELDVEIPVDEGSEIGVLQMGFNRMAHGLRERERMRDIFGRHVGPDVAARAITNEFALGGETVEATAMFVDMIASSALAEQRPPDEVVAVLNRYFDAVVRCVDVEGGYVNKFEGDGAMCIFGAPIPDSDHAARALRAARTLHAELRSMSEDIDAAIGISSGTVVAGNVGAANRYEYTIIGDAVNEAKRLTDEAKYRHTRVLASGSTVGRSGAEIRNWGHSGTIPLRGRARPTVAFEPGLI